MRLARAYASRAYPLVAALVLVALLLVPGMHLPHLTLAGGHAMPAPGHRAAQVSARDGASGDELLVALTADPGCHDLECLTPSRLDGADPPDTHAWQGQAAADSLELHPAPPAAPPQPWLPVSIRLAVLQRYRL